MPLRDMDREQMWLLPPSLDAASATYLAVTMSLITAPRASSRFLNRVDDTCPSSLLDLSPISGQSWVGQGAAIDLSALPIPHSP